MVWNQLAKSMLHAQNTNYCKDNISKHCAFCKLKIRFNVAMSQPVALKYEYIVSSTYQP